MQFHKGDEVRVVATELTGFVWCDSDGILVVHDIRDDDRFHGGESGCHARGIRPPPHAYRGRCYWYYDYRELELIDPGKVIVKVEADVKL